MTSLARPSCLQHRRGRPYFRLHVSDDVRSILGEREVVRALKGSDTRQIAAEVRRLRAAYGRLFDEARGQARS